MTITIALPVNRQHPGVLTLGDWSCPCLGLADQAAASKAGNPHRDPLRPMGDTPLGRCRGTLGPVQPNTHSYGPNRVIELQPLDGEALKAAQTDDGINLRPTHGCVRLADRDMATLISLLEAAGAAAFVVEIVQAA